MQKFTARKPRDWFMICSWVALIVIFAVLVIYMSVHVKDLLDADMSSELVLAQQLKQSGGILSANWFYSTEVRVLNTQLVYSLFFHLFDDWQTVRVLGNVTLYLILLASYYFLCKRLSITSYFPITAAILLLPLSAPYFYILLYGAYYIPRVSILFVILALLIQPPYKPGRKAGAITSTLIACVLSFALGLEGARMLLVLFVPLAIVAGAEFVVRIFSRRGQASVMPDLRMKADGFPLYFTQSFFACVSAVAGYWINQRILIRAYPFEQNVAITPSLTLGSIKSTVFNQIHLIGYETLSYSLSMVIWGIVGALFAWYLLRKGAKSASAQRVVWLCFASWVCFTTFCCLIDFGQAAWHLAAMAVLCIPTVALILCDKSLARVIRRAVSIFLCVCFLYIGIQGYLEFGNWPSRKQIRTSDSYQTITAVLDQQGYKNGYASFWNANILTELSDGAIDVWCVDTFDSDTTQSPDLFCWLQVKTHQTTHPTNQTFLVWTTEEYAFYGKENFSYLGNILYQDDAFIVFDVKQ